MVKMKIMPPSFRAIIKLLTLIFKGGNLMGG